MWRGWGGGGMQLYLGPWWGVGVEGCNQETWFKSVTQLLSHHLIIAVPTSSFTFPWTRPDINPLIYAYDKNYRFINVKEFINSFSWDKHIYRKVNVGMVIKYYFSRKSSRKWIQRFLIWAFEFSKNYHFRLQLQKSSVHNLCRIGWKIKFESCKYVKWEMYT